MFVVEFVSLRTISRYMCQTFLYIHELDSANYFDNPLWSITQEIVQHPTSSSVEQIKVKNCITENKDPHIERE